MRSLIYGLWLMAGALAVATASSLETQLEAAGGNASEIKAFLEGSRTIHGEFGAKAAVFLVEGMPAVDLKSLKKEFLLENLEWAMKARKSFPWAGEVPEQVFFNDILPYASLDESREPWRRDFYERAKALVIGCKTATDAAQAINRDFFKQIRVHYNPGRKAANQSPSESMALGMASCTGLSIILVDACRAVGIPARVAGTALWFNKIGNHTWVEIHDNGEWYFTGADEYNKEGLNRAWFMGDAAKAVESEWQHAIWASSWRRTGSHFPLVWNPDSREVAGVNVTARYQTVGKVKAEEFSLYLRLWDKLGGERLVAEIAVIDGDGKEVGNVTTTAGRADLNDMPEIKVKPGTSEYRLRVTRDSEVRWQDFKADTKSGETVDLIWSELSQDRPLMDEVRRWLELPKEERARSIPTNALTKEEADEVASLIWETLRKERQARIQADLETKVVKAAGKEMRYLEKSFGEAAEGQRSLWISMHGGGGAPARVNDQQWNNQIRLYAPKEGIVVTPRAPSDTWNLWHEAHIDDLFQELIDHFVMQRGVSPDRVYLMGYSAGGDGVYQLAPRMADRFAAASMMAGHPNDAKPLGLRNLPFMIFMGGNDAAYNRNKLAARWAVLLGDLRKADPAGYAYQVTIYEGLGHWMNGKDKEALPWMASHTRNPWPEKVVWLQSGRTHDRFYWLSVPMELAKAGQTVRAEVKGQQISLVTEGLERLNLRLSDSLLDLDQPIVVTLNGKECFRGKVPRDVSSLWQSLTQRMDLSSVSSASLGVDIETPP